MKKNYPVMYVFCHIHCLALKNIFDYLMVFGVGLGIVCLLCSSFFAGTNQKTSKAQ